MVQNLAGIAAAWAYVRWYSVWAQKCRLDPLVYTALELRRLGAVDT